MRIYLYILLVFVLTPAVAQNEIDTDLSENAAFVSGHDSLTQSKETALEIRIPPIKEIEKLIADRRFNYERKDKKLSLWELIKMYFVRYLSEATTNIMGYVVIFIVVFAIVFLLIKISGIRSIQRNTTNYSEVDIGTENINEMNFNALIRSALDNKDYRLCVRFMYLKNLKALSDRKIIEWDVNKTNFSYLNEIKNVDLHGSFLRLTILFDYVWYGHLQLNDESFAEAREQFDKLQIDNF